MYMYMYMYIYIYIYIMYTYTCTYTYIHIYIYTYTHIHIHTHVCTHTRNGAWLRRCREIVAGCAMQVKSIRQSEGNTCRGKRDKPARPASVVQGSADRAPRVGNRRHCREATFFRLFREGSESVQGAVLTLLSRRRGKFTQRRRSYAVVAQCT